MRLRPWKYRPDRYDEAFLPIDEDDVLDWEDNPISNSMAWVSDTFMPEACEHEDRKMVAVVNYLWADCACCLFWRGVTLGVVSTLGIAVTASLLL